MRNLKLKKLPAYFIVPAIFAVLGYGALRVALAPVWNLGVSIASLVIADDAPNFNPELSSTYNPEAEKPSDAPEDSEDDAISIDDIDLPSDGERYANVTCERIGLDSPVYWGDSSAILRNGAGHSKFSFLPGFGRIIVLSAHNTSFFKPLKDIEEGDVITLDTNYDTYKYNVTSVKVMHEDDLGKKIENMLLEEKETLMLYTCYPFHAISGRKTKRLVVLGERIEGVDVIWREQ